MSVKGFEILKDQCLESVGDCGVSSAQNPSEETNSLGLEQQLREALHKYHKSAGFFPYLCVNGSIVSCKGFSCSCSILCDIYSTLCSISKVI